MLFLMTVLSLDGCAVKSVFNPARKLRMWLTKWTFLIELLVRGKWRDVTPLHSCADLSNTWSTLHLYFSKFHLLLFLILLMFPLPLFCKQLVALVFPVAPGCS